MKWVSKKDVVSSNISDDNKIRIRSPFTVFIRTIDQLGSAPIYAISILPTQ